VKKKKKERTKDITEMPVFKRDNGHDDEGADDSRLDDGQAPPADEHTRLLPNRFDSSRGVMLSPDDPAVSPYNLWTVRVLRYLTILFTLLTFVWWVLMLVSAFATPPGFHTRGSGFYAFSYASLALANMLFTLIFFGVPSKSVRVLAVIMSVRTMPALRCLPSVSNGYFTRA
jgi:hypothetical protein